VPRQPCAHARLIERLASIIGCLLEHVEASHHARELVHADCQVCLDVRSACDLLDELVTGPLDSCCMDAPV